MIDRSKKKALLAAAGAAAVAVTAVVFWPDAPLPAGPSVRPVIEVFADGVRSNESGPVESALERLERSGVPVAHPYLDGMLLVRTETAWPGHERSRAATVWLTPGSMDEVFETASAVIPPAGMERIHLTMFDEEDLPYRIGRWKAESERAAAAAGFNEIWVGVYPSEIGLPYPTDGVVAIELITYHPVEVQPETLTRIPAAIADTGSDPRIPSGSVQAGWELHDGADPGPAAASSWPDPSFLWELSWDVPATAGDGREVADHVCAGAESGVEVSEMVEDVWVYRCEADQVKYTIWDMSDGVELQMGIIRD